jgi:hypothetical protein
MIKSLVWNGLAVAVILISSLFLSIPVLADDPPPGITANVNIVGNNPDVGVNIYGNNPGVWINGAPLPGIISSATSAATSAAIAGSTPNGGYSGASTGTLPPLGNSPALAGLNTGGQYNNPLPGWRGYFCPTSNNDPAVYHGSGCGGKWGVADGWPDYWSRRQIAGLAPEFYAEKEKMNTAINALAKIIGEIGKYNVLFGISNVKTNGDGSGNGNGNGNGQVASVASSTLEDLKKSLVQLEDVKLNLSVLEQEHADLASLVQQQKTEFDQKLLLMVLIFVFSVLCLGGALLYLNRKWRGAY